MATLLEYAEARKLLDRYGIRSVDSAYVSSAEDAIRFSDGKRVVLKVISGKALHKSRSGLVVVDPEGDRGIRQAYGELHRKAGKLSPYRILAQRMISGGTEIIIGGKTDAQFGKLILLGLGGVYVETFRDFALRVCPITGRDADSMIDQLRSSKVIAPDDGSRAMLKSLLIRASKMFYENRISELDLNPVILHDGTYDAVDLRLMR